MTPYRNVSFVPISCPIVAQLVPNFGDFELCAFKMASTAQISMSITLFYSFYSVWLLFELTQAQIAVQTLFESPLEPCRLLVLVHKTLLIMGIDSVLHSEPNA